MVRRLRPLVTLQDTRPVAVQPLEVHGVDRVFLTLEPVTGDFREDDLHEAVAPGERLPRGHERDRRWPPGGPQQAGPGLHGVRLDTHGVLEASLGIGDLPEGLLQAPAGVIPHPAVVMAAQPAALDPSIGYVGAAMRAVPGSDTIGARLVPAETEILAQQPHRLRPISV